MYDRSRASARLDSILSSSARHALASGLYCRLLSHFLWARHRLPPSPHRLSPLDLCVFAFSTMGYISSLKPRTKGILLPFATQGERITGGGGMPERLAADVGGRATTRFVLCCSTQSVLCYCRLDSSADHPSLLVSYRSACLGSSPKWVWRCLLLSWTRRGVASMLT